MTKVFDRGCLEISNKTGKRNPFPDLTGEKFGNWTVEGKATGKTNGEYLVTCACGNKAVIKGYILRGGRSLMCVSCFKRKRREKTSYYLMLKGIVSRDDID